MPDLLRPVVILLGSALAATHSLAAGLVGEGPAAWLLAVTALVCGVRLLLVPVTVHGVRTARAAARARPELAALQAAYADLRHPSAEDLRELNRRRAAIHAEHGVSRWGCLPAALQLPLLLAMYHLLSDLAAGRPVGVLDGAVLASAASVSVLGLRLATRLSDVATRDPSAAGVLLVLAVTSSLVTYVTQRYFVLPATDLSAMPESMAQVQGWLPSLSAVGVLVGAWMAPAGLVVYWLLSGLWGLGQQAVVCRVAPAPGSPADRARARRRTPVSS